jgi:uncharacterized protein
MIADQDLRVLVELRDLDRETDRLRERALVIPRELDRLAKALAVHQEILDEEQRRLTELQMDRRAAEREIESAKEKRRSFEEAQFKIRNNQEYQANLREIESMKERVTLYDSRAVEILLQEDDVQKEITRLKQVVGEEKRKHDEIADRLKAELTVVQGALDAKEKIRQSTVERLSGPLRTKYERIRRSKGDLAIVGVESGACGGCGYALPPQRLQEVRRNRDIVLCEGCGRILVASLDE